MPKFTLVCDHSNALDTHVVTHTFNSEYLPDVLEHIDYFLKGAGYVYDGVVDIIPPEETITEGHSDFYYDTTRNR